MKNLSEKQRKMLRGNHHPLYKQAISLDSHARCCTKNPFAQKEFRKEFLGRKKIVGWKVSENFQKELMQSLRILFTLQKNYTHYCWFDKFAMAAILV